MSTFRNKDIPLNIFIWYRTLDSLHCNKPLFFVTPDQETQLGTKKNEVEKFNDNLPNKKNLFIIPSNSIQIRFNENIYAFLRILY